MPVSPLYDANPYAPITILFDTTDVDYFRPIWTRGIEAIGDPLFYPYNITAAWWGLSGEPPYAQWKAFMTVALDPSFTYPDPPPETVYLQYTIYYLYQ